LDGAHKPRNKRAGYKYSRSLMQFDLLTDEQLIAICKSGDPLAGIKN